MTTLVTRGGGACACVCLCVFACFVRVLVCMVFVRARVCESASVSMTVFVRCALARTPRVLLSQVGHTHCNRHLPRVARRRRSVRQGPPSRCVPAAASRCRRRGARVRLRLSASLLLTCGARWGCLSSPSSMVTRSTRHDRSTSASWVRCACVRVRVRSDMHAHMCLCACVPLHHSHAFAAAARAVLAVLIAYFMRRRHVNSWKAYVFIAG